ncbi:MAG: GNAT family N-acetyltransferase [Halieaceae bacterium]|nr:GNAT family N-acetyltransferase [Halieaceae bacterium]
MTPAAAKPPVRVLTFDCITPEVIEYGRAFSYDVAPGPGELAEYARFVDIQQRILVLLQGERCVGMACCQLEDTTLGKVPCRVYSAFGQGFFDYSKLCYSDGFGAELVRELLTDARTQGADILFLADTLLDDPSLLDGGFVRSKPTALFDRAREEKGYQPLLSKKSVKRHVNKCKRTFEYGVEHFTGAGIAAALVTEMGKLHIETRRFHGDSSVFERQGAGDRYLASSPQRVLTRISVNDDTLAFHYGMVFGDTMIWHTPVVNIKYLDYSPLEVLLYETVSYCERMGYGVLDLGIGDEPYKERFSNSRRPVYEYSHPISLKGKMAQSLRAAKRNPIVERGVVAIANRIRPRGGTAAGSGPAPDRYRVPRDRLPASRAGEIAAMTHFGDYVEYCRKTSRPIDRAAYERFRSGCICFAAGTRASCWAGKAPPAGAGATEGDGAVAPPVIRALHSAGGPGLERLASLLCAVADHFAAPEVLVEVPRGEKVLREWLLAAGAQRSDE